MGALTGSGTLFRGGRVTYAEVKENARGLLRPLAQYVADLGIPPTAITVAGLAFSVLAALSLGTGHFLRAAVLLVIAGVCDMIDGASARAGNRTSPRGAFLDSTIDRYSDAVVLLGAMHYYLVRAPGAPEVLTAGIVLVALAGSMLTSYTRARAESIGEDCRVGIAERSERMILLIVGAAFGHDVLRVALWLLATASHVTAIQRVRHIMACSGRDRGLR
ncbi:MAG: CDP-alcohol phosphatidyltransferase family protein [Candidatus Eisenbacteria bacterium]|nr:CDP-alcohol phosphatidyltransferase family protein [Candidatus Eisenbacteria bacterium]